MWWWFNHQVVSDSWDPMDYTCQALLSVEFCRQKILEWVAISFSREPYLTQGLNPSLLHCRWILYWQSYQGNPNIDILSIKKKKKNSLIPLLGKGCGEDTVGSYPGKLSQSRRIWWGVYSSWFKGGITDKIWCVGGLRCHIFLPFHTVHEILEARILEWLAVPSSSGPCLSGLFSEQQHIIRSVSVAPLIWLQIKSFSGSLEELLWFF